MMTAMQQQMSKPLGALIDLADGSLAELTVQGVAIDSRCITEGDLFLAYPGINVDGRDYIDSAISAGAAAVLVQADEQWSTHFVRDAVPVVIVDGLAAKVSTIAGRFYDDPSHAMPVIGVTGTNGKTSCTQLIMQLLVALGQDCGVIGTLGYGINEQLQESPNTTPDAIKIQAALAQWRDAGVPWVAMEVSSHGLEQHRVAGVQFDTAVFTNLSRDHLDYHGSMQAYGASKARLFQYPGLRRAIINLDDPFSAVLENLLAKNVEVLRFSVQGHAAADVCLQDISYHSDGVSATLHSPWGQMAISSPLWGPFNLSNMLVAIITLAAVGFGLEAIVKQVGSVKTVAGRMQQIDSHANINVVVDYAHTPDALAQALQAIRLHTRGKCWCVFGCGGDRDQGKRPLMGETVQRFADHSVVTSDNPRNESAHAIINEILSGIDRPTLVEEDRAKAIAFAITHAQPGDSVLIAGKGHEDYQLVGDQRLPFSDVKQARLALAERVNDGADPTADSGQHRGGEL